MLKKFDLPKSGFLLLAGVLLVFAAIPLTVNSLQRVEQTNKSVNAATPCATNCGDPRYFCDTWTGGFCDDYRDLYCPTLNFLADCPFPGTVRSNVTTNYLSSTDPNYTTHIDGVETKGGFFFNQQEHFHTEVYDGNFGMAIVREHEPFDFAGRAGHMHVEMDLKTSARRYVRLLFSPELTKTLVDERQDNPRPSNGLDIWFINGTLAVNLYRNATLTELQSITYPRYYGVDNVRDDVDVYLSRTHLKINIQGTTFLDYDLPDIGFDRSYIYLNQVSYNPCKDNECSENLQIFHWDNFAFDGPSLPTNSLTPVGKRDIIFNAGWTNSCAVKGVNATMVGPLGSGTGSWASYVARFPDDGTSITPADVSCNWVNNVSHSIYAFEVVKAGTTSTNPPPSCTKPGDVNCDNSVNITDLNILINKWGSTDSAVDLNHSGKVDLADLTILINNWGR